MGIGFALASGLVGGFTRNIQAEMERRASDEDKLDTYRALLMKAGLEGDAPQKNIDLISGFIQNAQQKLDDREKIGLFGKQSETVNLDNDFTSILSTLEPAEKEEFDEARTFLYENKPYYTFNREVRNASNTYDATANLSEITYMIGHNQGAIDKWKAAPASVKEDILQVVRFNAQALAIDVEKARSEGQDILNLDAMGLTGTTDALEKFLQMGIPEYEIGNLIGSAFRNLAEEEAGVPKGSSGSTVATDRGLTNIDAPGDGEDPAYNALYTSFGVDVGNLDALNISWSKYTNIFDMTDADSDALWDKTIQFMTVNNITTQFQDSSAIGMMNEKQAARYIESLEAITGGNVQEMALIIGALYTPRRFTETKTPSATRVANTGSKTITEEDIRLYTAKVIFGSYATEKDFTAIVDQDAQLDKVLSEEVGLGALLNIADKEMQTIPLAYAVASKFAGITNLVGFVFGGNEETTKAANVSVFAIEDATDGKTIIIDASTGDVVSGVSGEGFQRAIDEGEVMTTGYIDSLNNRISMARQRARDNYNNRPEDMRDMSLEDMEEMYARFESLRISLAFQMARAADPSGRLSDQDVKQMMALLGGDINTPRAMKAKIKRAMDEFEYQRQRFSAVVPFAFASGKATRTDKLRVHGVHGLDVIAKKAGYLGSSDLQAQAAASQEVTVIPPGENEKYSVGAVKVGDITYMPGGNGTWYPDGSFADEVTDQELLKKLNAAMPGT